jgi:hypothetical protein
VPTVLKSGSLNLLETSGPVQTCNGIALPFYIQSVKPENVQLCSEMHFHFVNIFEHHRLPSISNRQYVYVPEALLTLHASHGKTLSITCSSYYASSCLTMQFTGISVVTVWEELLRDGRHWPRGQGEGNTTVKQKPHCTVPCICCLRLRS